MITIPYQFKKALSIINQIKKIDKDFDFFITGSLAFYLFDMPFDREIGDLDIVCKQKYVELINKLLKIDSTDNEELDEESEYKNDNQRHTLFFNDTKIDIFISDSFANKKYIIVDGFKVLHPIYSIQAKVNYVQDYTTRIESEINASKISGYLKTLNKHLSDIDCFYKHTNFKKSFDNVFMKCSECKNTFNKKELFVGSYKIRDFGKRIERFDYFCSSKCLETCKIGILNVGD